MVTWVAFIFELHHYIWITSTFINSWWTILYTIFWYLGSTSVLTDGTNCL